MVEFSLLATLALRGSQPLLAESIRLPNFCQIGVAIFLFFFAPRKTLFVVLRMQPSFSNLAPIDQYCLSCDVPPAISRGPVFYRQNDVPRAAFEKWHSQRSKPTEVCDVINDGTRHRPRMTKQD
jgi:hypothetical protein